jgi:hypothetical protein
LPEAMPQIVCVLKTVRENDLVALNPQIVQRRICSKDARRAAGAFDGRLQMTLPLVVPLEIAEVLRIVFQEFEVVGRLPRLRAESTAQGGMRKSSRNAKKPGFSGSVGQ